MDLLATVGAAISWVGLAVAGTLAILVFRTNPRAALNRRLALVLSMEALILATLIASMPYQPPNLRPLWLEGLGYSGFFGLSVAYLAFLALLGSPYARVFRRGPALVVLGIILVAMSTSAFVFGNPGRYGDGPYHVIPDIAEFVGAFGFLGVAVFGLIVTISAYRRTAPGTELKRRAAAMLTAFAARDALWLVIIGTAVTLAIRGNDAVSEALWTYGPAVVILLYVPILSYGILRTQVFDIDLKIKVGISRSTVAMVGVIAVLAAAKVAELYLSRQVGFVAGGVAAGAVLFLAPRLNRLGDKVANATMPKVQPTPVYLTFKKLEVYRAAVESAIETGGISARERATLDRLREKLGLSGEDTAALELEIPLAAPAPQVVAA